MTSRSPGPIAANPLSSCPTNFPPVLNNCVAGLFGLFIKASKLNTLPSFFENSLCRSRIFASFLKDFASISENPLKKGLTESCNLSVSKRPLSDPPLPIKASIVSSIGLNALLKLFIKAVSLPKSSAVM